MTDIKRDISRETWNGMKVIAYHWLERSGLPEPSSQELDRIAYHWSTGPKTADRLVKLDDVIAYTSDMTERLKRYEAALRTYGQQFCELGEFHDACGKMRDVDCSGCLARTALAPSHDQA